MGTAWLVLASAVALFGAFLLGAHWARRNLRPRTTTEVMRDQVAAYQVIGHDREAAQQLLRQQNAAGLRKMGVFDA